MKTMQNARVLPAQTSHYFNPHSTMFTNFMNDTGLTPSQTYGKSKRASMMFPCFPPVINHHHCHSPVPDKNGQTKHTQRNDNGTIVLWERKDRSLRHCNTQTGRGTKAPCEQLSIG